MEYKLFVSRRGNKIPFLLEEISYDLGKTWTPTGKSKYDEENIEIDSCDCSEQYRWVLVEGEEIDNYPYVYEKHKLQVKYGCDDWKDYEPSIVRTGEILRDSELAPPKHESRPNDKGGFDEWVYDEEDGEWHNTSCDTEGDDDPWGGTEVKDPTDGTDFWDTPKDYDDTIPDDIRKPSCEPDILNCTTIDGEPYQYYYDGKYYTAESNIDYKIDIKKWCNANNFLLDQTNLYKVNKLPSTSNLTSAEYMFKGCKNLVSINYDGVDFSGVSGYHMYEDCWNLKYINTCGMKKIASYFARNCYSVEQIDMQGILEVPTNYYNFMNCSKLRILNLGNCILGDNSVGSTNAYVFSGAYSIESINIANSPYETLYALTYSMCYYHSTEYQNTINPFSVIKGNFCQNKD